MTSGSLVIVWFRRDLRLADNATLHAAISHANATGGSVLPLFVLDPSLGSSAGANRLAYLYDALRSLKSDGLPLIVRLGSPVREVPALAEELAASAVYVADDFTPFGRRRDSAVAVELARRNVAFERVDTPYVIAPGTVLKSDGTPFKVFTPFKRVWEPMAHGVMPGSPVDPHLAPWWRDTVSEEIPPRPSNAARLLPEASEVAAKKRFDTFVARHLDDYDEIRNDPGADATSRLSADLKFGLIHPRQLLPALRRPGKGAEVFRSELCWREFYADVLWHHPSSARRALQPKMEHMRVDVGPRADERFRAWCEGKTGYPFIDAGMRQLRAEGWMHNRVRMAVASFLLKDLHLDWRSGAQWFMDHLADGDIASNQHGWQWTAGTGTDASPYFRVFNPVSQGKKFDADGTYVRRWVPELAALEARWIHEPWLAPRPTRSLFETSPESDGAERYPERIVDHAAERDEALARYGEVRGSVSA